MAYTCQISVPLDHQNRAETTFLLSYTLAHPFDPEKSTLFLLHDGQQTAADEAELLDWQRQLGTGWNCVAIEGRGNQVETLLPYCRRSDRSVDFKRAYALFKASQWVNDIESIRSHLLGETGTVSLYGSSGGGWLVHQYLQKYGQFVSRAYTKVSAAPEFDAPLELRYDHFWWGIKKYHDPATRQCHQVLQDYPEQRIAILRTLHALGYDLHGAERQQAQIRLLEELSQGNFRTFSQLSEKYHIEERMLFLGQSPYAAAMNARLFELYAPRHHLYTEESDVIYPLMEFLRYAAHDYLSAWNERQISPCMLDLNGPFDTPAEMCMVAGRHDTATDYRAQYALAQQYRASTFLLCNATHHLPQSQLTYKEESLAPVFFREGLSSRQFQEHCLALKGNGRYDEIFSKNRATATVSS